MTDTSAAKIDAARLSSLLDGLNQFGRNPDSGGFNRPGFSDADLAARRWLSARMESEGLSVQWDAAGNVFGRLGPEDRPSIMVGSHADTVPEGGAFDGTLGVAVALECVLALRDAGTLPDYPIEVVATSEEEGRFGGMLGSQAMVGAITPEWLEQAADANDVRLWDVMLAQGLDPSLIPGARREPGSVRAFLELHIEQGPVLERRGTSIGIVDSVSGVTNWSVSLFGEANHSGTTPMSMRADAFAGLAEAAGRIPDIIVKLGSEQSRITIGKVDLQPNFPHTVPGQADFSVVLRDTDESIMRALCAAFRETVEQACRNHNLTHEIIERSWLEPVRLDQGIARLLTEEAAALGLSHMIMPSGAGHDAQTMQALCPSGLIFVPSRGGVSHAPEEWTDWPAILDGAQLMLNALLRLSRAET
ncbi:Zn-dependent hydrolase [Aquibaculum arenosum]|uniref:Zn-dependent hydrolase n=1 Tax=Aquibaculum arenosum TaxID=3032591 RepID=A0ABT5YHQ7_9PROT|nr:Zn-dependent hydrolase [Fodinicurvata sp. CAU 1616]MDF2094468.1 Zn-dependent hydrolase [Fodinicurvata sp. CAU 1616]